MGINYRLYDKKEGIYYVCKENRRYPLFLFFANGILNTTQ